MLKTSLICIRIASAIYLLLGIAVCLLPQVDSTAKTILLIATFGMVFWCEITAWGLKKTKKWSWVSAVILFALFIPSAFFLLGIFGMINMMNNDVRDMFSGRPYNPNKESQSAGKEANDEDIEDKEDW
jgi:thiol:disulfide interchange protein